MKEKMGKGGVSLKKFDLTLLLRTPPKVKLMKPAARPFQLQFFI